MDWATRRVFSWRLSNTLDARFCTEALTEALKHYGRPEILNTDQPAVHQPGVHLRAQRRWRHHFHGRQGPVPGQHLHERLWRSLKYEAVYLHELSDGFQAQRLVARWFNFYDRGRPHSALGGSTPAEAYQNGMLMEIQAEPHGLPAPLPAQSEQRDVFNRTLAA